MIDLSRLSESVLRRLVVLLRVERFFAVRLLVALFTALFLFGVLLFAALFFAVLFLVDFLARFIVALRG